MKKFITVMLVLAMVLAMTSVAFAYDVKKVSKYVEFTKSAWGYEKVTNNYGRNKGVALKKGSIVYVQAVKGDWYQARIPSRTAGKYDLYWFNKKYTKTAAGDGIYIIFSSGGSGRSHVFWAPEKAANEIKGMTVKTSGKVNMRKTASLAGKSQGVIPKGKKVTLTGRLGMDSCGVIFFQVKYNGKTSYISGEYIRRSDAIKAFNRIPDSYYWSDDDFDD